MSDTTPLLPDRPATTPRDSHVGRHLDALSPSSILGFVLTLTPSARSQSTSEPATHPGVSSLRTYWHSSDSSSQATSALSLASLSSTSLNRKTSTPSGGSHFNSRLSLSFSFGHTTISPQSVRGFFSTTPSSVTNFCLKDLDHHASRFSSPTLRRL